jgi:hypothetical protein
VAAIFGAASLMAAAFLNLLPKAIDSMLSIYWWCQLFIAWLAFFGLVWRVFPRIGWPTGPASYVVALAGLATGSALCLYIILAITFSSPVT